MAENPYAGTRDYEGIACRDAWQDGYDEGITVNAGATAETIERAVDSAKPQWRPIPDEAPEDGWYWVRHRDGKIGVRDIFDGQVYQGGGDYAHEWGCAGATHIAGPIEPPEGE